MKADEIVERIMAQHWDLAACKCWICEHGRAEGLGAREDYLPHKSEIKLARVFVKGEG